jgi:hypothetical protein
MIKIWNKILEDPELKRYEHYNMLVLLKMAYELKLEGKEILDSEYYLFKAEFLTDDKRKYHHGGM